MTDWNRNDYKNQYKKETSQIHAPADLIQRTRQAVAEEEQKMQMENISVAPAGEMQQEEKPEQKPEVSDISRDMQKQRMKPYGSNHRIHYRKAYKWALPVAAAAILMLVLNISTMPRNGGASGAALDFSPEMEAGGDYGEDGAMSGSAEMEAEGSDETDGVMSGLAEAAAKEGDWAASSAEAAAVDGGAEETGSLEEGSVLEKAENSEEIGGLGDVEAAGEDSDAGQQASAGMSDINAASVESSSLAREDNGDMGSEGNHYAGADRYDGMSEDHAADIVENLERKYSYQESDQEDAAAQVQITEVQKIMEEFLEKAYEVLLEIVM